MINLSDTLPAPSANRAARILVVVIISLSAYLNTLWNGFVWDDERLVVWNPWIRDVSRIPDIFMSGVWSFRGYESNYYRPVMHLVYMLDFRLFGMAPLGYHLVNVLMHAAVCVMVYLVAERLVRDHGVSGTQTGSYVPLVSAVIFAVHPLHSEPVAWVAGAPDVTYGFFFLLSLYIYIGSFRPDGQSSVPALIASASAFFVSMLCKEPAVVLPGVLLCYDYTTRRFRGGAGHIFRYAPYVVAMAAYFIVRYWAIGGLMPHEEQRGLGVIGNIAGAFVLFARYMEKMLLPVNLNAFYSFNKEAFTFGPVMLASLVLSAVCFIAFVYLLRRRSMAAVGMALVVLPLVPALHLTAISAGVMADRYMYLPVSGFALLVSMSFSAASSRSQGWKRLSVAGLVLVAAFYIVSTTARNGVWKDDYTLWSDCVVKSPNAAMPHANYGLALLNRGRFDEAIKELNAAISIEDVLEYPHVNLGFAYLRKGMHDRSVAECRAALAINPQNDTAHHCLAVNFLETGHYGAALDECREAVRIFSGDPAHHDTLGRIYANLGRWDEAVKELEEAVKMSPDDADARVNLGITYAAMGMRDRAVGQFQEAIRINPSNALAHANLGVAFMEAGLDDKAEMEFKRAVELDPEDDAFRGKLDELRDAPRR